MVGASIGAMMCDAVQLPEYFTRSLRENLKHASFATNPCRLRFFTQVRKSGFGLSVVFF